MEEGEEKWGYSVCEKEKGLRSWRVGDPVNRKVRSKE